MWGDPPSSGIPTRCRHYTRTDAIARYRIWLRQQWQRHGEVHAALLELARLYTEREQLTLLCWCAPRRCHAEVIREAVLGIVQHGLVERQPAHQAPPAGPHRPQGGLMKLIIAGSRTFTDYQSAVPGAGAGSPPHRTGPHGRGPGRGSARLPLGVEAPGQASALPRGMGALREVRRYAAQSPDGPGWRCPRRVLGRPIARHRAHDPVHGAAGQARDRGALRAMNGPAGATVAGGGVTASSGARRSVARSWRSPVAPPCTHATHKKWELGTCSSSHPRASEPCECSLARRINPLIHEGSDPWPRPYHIVSPPRKPTP